MTPLIQRLRAGGRRRAVDSTIAAIVLVAAGALPLTLAAQKPTFPELAPDGDAGAGRIAPCAIERVAGSARCGVFRVWEDRDRRAGRTVDVSFIVLDALDAQARTDDAVLLLPGGPGEAFIANAAAYSRNLADLRRARDILLVDVRGVGRSQALDCTVPFPGGLRSRFGTLFPPAHAAACRDSLARRADLAQYTTASTVDDLEELRAWLGYPRLNLMGGSYGTRVAQVYMRRHPESVRTAVLNGVSPIAEPGYVHHARLLQRSLDRLVAECAADESCRSEHPDFAAVLNRVLTRMRAGPVEVEVEGERIPFSIGDLSYALRGLLYARGRALPHFISRAAAGDVDPLVEYYLERTAWISAPGGSAGYHFSVLCAEDIAPLTDADVRRATSGTFMGAHLIDGYRAVCDVWPYVRLPDSHWKPVRSDTPTLLLSGGRDPVTPAEGGESVARHLSNAFHVVVPGGGHGVGGPCIQRLVRELIRTASVEHLDTSCIPGP